jgi:hypothetical protein
MNRIAFVVLAGIALGACAESNKYLPAQRADSSYVKQTMGFTTNVGRYDAAVYHKAFDSNGRLAMCGYVVVQTSSCHAVMIAEWFKTADLTLGDAPVGKADFIKRTTPGYNEYDTSASCVETQVPWRPSLRTAPMKITGSNVQGQC